MNLLLVRRLKALAGGAAILLAAATLPTTAASATTGPNLQGEPTKACQGPSLLTTLRGLRSSDHIKVRKTSGRLTVVDVATNKAVFTAGCKNVVQHGDTAEAPRPAERRTAKTIVRRDARGAVVYTHSVTARGARATVFEKGAVTSLALHVTSFDNDDFHIADGNGALVHSVTTKSDGTLVEREGNSYGCGCERITHPDGKTETRPLP